MRLSLAFVRFLFHWGFMTEDILIFIDALPDWVLIAVPMLLAALFGWVCAGLWQRGTLHEAQRAAATADAQLAAVREQLVQREAQANELRDGTTDLAAENSALRARLEAQASQFAQQAKTLGDVRGELEKEMKLLAQQALQSNQQNFITMANQVFEKHRTAASGDLAQKKESIAAMLKPLGETVARYQKEQREAYGNLSQEVQSLARQSATAASATGKLVNALRASPKTRGRWGEHQLKTVLELAGMSEHVDFETEKTLQGMEGTVRPDAVIRLPGERFIVVDAKTSLSGYLEALETDDPALQDAALLKHAKEIRSHMRGLAEKKYWTALPFTPDFVAMFIPGENFFAAAAERDPTLFEDAVAKKVLIVTPTTLVALSKAIAYGWRQETMSKNAAEIAETGQELYKRLANLGQRVSDLGDALTQSVNRYNGFIGTLEGQVMPQARKFNDLQVEGSQDPLPKLEVLDADPRDPKRGRDLQFDFDVPPKQVQ
jgi:DNA recombination protein RmuC